MKIAALRVKLTPDGVDITSMGHSPRGTQVRLQTVRAKGRKEDKKTFQKNVLNAIEELIEPSDNT